MPHQQTSNGTPYPTYWPSDGWSAGWGGSDELGQILPAVRDGGSVADYMTTQLSRSSSVGRAICTYLSRSTTALSYKSQEREATRMGHARWALDQHAQGVAGHLLTAKQKLGLEFNLREGKKDGPARPASGPIEVRKIKIIRNESLWDAYVATREQLRGDLASDTDKLGKVSWSYSYTTAVAGFPAIPLLDPAVGETLLFHGTSREVMKLIAKGGFKPDIGRNKGTAEKPDYGALGQGAYFSDNFAKVMTYTACRHCFRYRCDCSHGAGHGSKRLTILSRVILGHPKKKRGMLQAGGNLRSQTVKDNKDGRHSVYAKGTGSNLFSRAAGTNEFLVKDAAQIYPEFVIYWAHAG